MPIYEYRCSSCGHQQEFIQKLSAAPLTTCTKCGKESFSKMLTAAGFQLKGSGWYATDFKGGGASKPAVKTGDAAAASDKGESPAAKTEAGTSKGEGAAKPAETASTSSTKESAAAKPASTPGPSSPSNQ